MVAWDGSVESTLAEVVLGSRPAHASNCKAAAKSEEDFFMSWVFPLVQCGRLFQVLPKGFAVL